LKGINTPMLDPNTDPGEDAKTGGLNENYATDAFGMALQYFDGDFNKSSSPFHSSDASWLTPQYNLYTGNFAAWTSKIDHQAPSLEYQQTTGHIYTYDELGRLKSASMNYHDGNWQTTNDYFSSYEYDANGNITQLRRNAHADTINMDHLTYGYPTTSNRLDYVADTVASVRWNTDIDDQAPGNYTYDATGRLLADVSENITNINWYSNDKPNTIEQSDAPDLKFVYDAMGNRVMKIKQPAANHASWDTTYYVHGPNGTTLARYKRSGGVLSLEEQHIYGLKRLGMYRLAEEIDTAASPVSTTYSRNIGLRAYELKDHLGNVRAVVSDIKLPDTPGGPYSADVLSYNNYYAYGSPQPGRTFSSDDYNYGFNGMEKDDEVKGGGNSYDFGARIYDSRLGRWLSLDPLAAKFPGKSPYNGMGDNPILNIDPDGREEITGTIHKFTNCIVVCIDNIVCRINI